MNSIKEKFSYVKLGINSKIPISSHMNWQIEQCLYGKVKNHKGNLGLSTGKISNGIYVLDWDFRLNQKEEGFKVIYEEYKKTFPKLSKTQIISTPHGYHFYYILKNVNYPNTSQKNGGYSNTLKTFIGSNLVRFGKFLKGFDSRGDGGYVVYPPSVVNGLKYEIYNNIEPLEITDKEYEQIFDFFKEKDIIKHTMRSGFVDIATGKINPQKYKQTTKLDEHVYWKEFYHEVCSCLGLLPEDVLDGLEKNNEGFDREKTIKQLNNTKNINYILNGKRMSSEKYKEYFPNYKQNNHITIQRKESLEILLSSITKESSTKDIDNILILFDEKDIRKYTDTINELVKKTGIGKRALIIRYKDVKLHQQEEKEQKLKNDIFSDEVEREGLICSFEYKKGDVENWEDGVYFITVNVDGFSNKEPILPYGFEIIHKTQQINLDLYSYKFGGKIFNTKTRVEILNHLKDYRIGGERGQDILKMLITFMGDQLEYKKLETILGFNNKWVLPQLQEENNYRILVTTDFQKRIYHNTKNIISNNFDKKKTKEKLLEFLERTKMIESKAAMIIGWSIAQLFRLSFIRYFKLAPDLLLIGDPQTGKTAFSEVCVVDFYKAWKIPLQGAQIATKSSLEDAASTSTFPILADELEYIAINAIDPLKARSTLITEFSRKTSGSEMFRKPEVAGFCMTTNDTPKAFYNSALIERFIVIKYSLSEIITEDQEWNDIAREIKKMNIFSQIYDFTKDWTDDNVFNLIKSIQASERFTSDTRLRNKYIFVFFGLIIFKNIFDIDLIRDLDISLFEQSGSIITGDLLNDFIVYCNDAINFIFDEDGNRAPSNKKYITCPLEKNSTGDYIFTSANLRDFKEFISERKYNLKSLSSQLNKGIMKKTYFNYGSYSLKGITYTCIKIPHNFNWKYGKLKKNI